jgi:protein subunit release factor B
MTRLCLTVSSGTGPVEAREFVRLLADALARELSACGAAIEHTLVHGSAAQPSSVDLVFEGSLALVLHLLGTHALLMPSARRGKRDRKRWYVGVTCTETPRVARTLLSASDVFIETCRAGGAGGQHVNRTESAVRAVHRPSGLSVRIESERSQHQNKARALAALAAALAAREAVRHAADKQARRNRSIHVERGCAVVTWRYSNGALLRSDGTGENHAL